LRQYYSWYEESALSDFRMLVKDQLPRLIRYAAALTHDADEALDLAEDTVLEALASAHEQPSDTGLRVWLLTILHDHRRNPFRRDNPLADLSGPENNSAPLSLSELDRALGELPEEQRAVLLLVGLEGMSEAETATVMRMPIGAVRVRLARARENLCRTLGVTQDWRQAA
jgi:RNA polymerase sigma-70 factor, ECF subfamily